VADLPTVTAVFLAHNRREELRLSLEKTLDERQYPTGRLDVIVVDNASSDGTEEMLAHDFPRVKVVKRSRNCGISGWNDGFDLATGEYVLVLDDDCYLPDGALERAAEGAEADRADLVSFGVTSSADPSWRFDLDEFQTGLLSYWGCAALVRRDVLQTLGGYDAEIFVSLHELEFMFRFFDRGYRHLHLPEVVAVHAKLPGTFSTGPLPECAYRLIYWNLGYITAKQLRRRDAAGALVAIVVRTLRDGLRLDRVAFKAPLDILRGVAHGLRHRQPVRPEVSRAYRRNFETFVGPWELSRTPVQMVRELVRRPVETGDRGRRREWLAARARFYPQRAGSLEL